MTGFTRNYDLNDPAETTALAEHIAPRVGPGDVILLGGDLGAGKTHFARSLIQSRLAAAGLSEDVPSPTFTLVQTYDDGQVEIWHADLYRLGHSDEIVELGLDVAFESAICLIEWPERLGESTPTDAVRLTFEMSKKPGFRRATATWADERWATVLPEPAQ